MSANQTKEKVLDGDWVEADLTNPKKKDGEDKKEEKKIMDLDDEEEDKKAPKPEEKKENKVLDLDDDEEIKKEEKKEEKKASDFDDFCVIEGEEEDGGKVLKTRTYDVTVTYDLYYCVPRMWLIGYSEKGSVLTTEEMEMDIMPEYRNKTVTIEPHPITGIKNISVHPCRHSMLLKKMIENFEKSGKKLEVYMCIVLFLKFLHSVVPTIQYDFTMDISF
ncbi:MAG: autophagy-related protein [archaeon]|nr:autophagy-related protein [archaeon]